MFHEIFNVEGQKISFDSLVCTHRFVQYLFSYRGICIFHRRQSRSMAKLINDCHWPVFRQQNIVGFVWEQKCVYQMLSRWMPLHPTSYDDVCNNKNLSREREMQRMLTDMSHSSDFFPSRECTLVHCMQIFITESDGGSF